MEKQNQKQNQKHVKNNEEDILETMSKDKEEFDKREEGDVEEVYEEGELEEEIEEEVEEETEEEPSKTKSTKDYQDRHVQVDAYKDKGNIKDIPTEEVGRSVIIPTTIFNTLKDMLTKVSDYTEEEFAELFTEQEQDALKFSYMGERYTVRNNVFVERLNEEFSKFVNKINFGEHKLNMRSLNFKQSKGQLSPRQASLRFRTLMSIGEAVQVPLWHTGIWVTIKPPTQADIINLQLSLASSEIELGRDTSSLIYSNYAVVYNRIVADFIIKHIDSHTLKLNDDEDLRDFIVMQDYFPLVLGILSSIYPKGIHVVRSCQNTIHFGEDKKPLCDFVAGAQLDPRKLLWVDRSSLSTRLLSHMSNRMEASMSKDSIKEYQLGIEQLLEKDYELNTETDVKFTVKLGIPKLSEHIIAGEKWVNNIIKKTEAIFTDADDTNSKNIKINELAAASILGMYNAFVKSITFDGTTVNDPEGVTELLSDISSDDVAFTGFVKVVSEYITNSSIAIVATPNYTCPSCNKNQNENKTGPFKEFIPINIVEHFFVLCALRTEKTRQRIL